MKFSNLDSILNEIKQIAKLCYEKGWSESNAGNFSINITHSPWLNSLELNKIPFDIPKCKYPFLYNQTLIISNANSKFRDISNSPKRFICIFKISSDGTCNLFSLIEDLNNISPTSELKTHLAVHNAQIAIENKNIAILHAHPTALIVLSLLKEEKSNENITELMTKHYPELALFLPEGIGFIPYLTPGSFELAIETSENSKKYRLNIWEKHGCITIGKSLSEAFDFIDIAEKSAKIYLLAKKYRSI